MKRFIVNGLHAHWWDRLFRLVQPPAPFIMNPAEPKDFPLGRWNLYIGGAGRVVEGYVNLDLFAMPGVECCGRCGTTAFPSGHVSARGVRCGAGARSRSGTGDVRDPTRAGSRRLRSSGDAVLSPVSRVPTRLSKIHSGWTEGIVRRQCRLSPKDGARVRRRLCWFLSSNT